MFIVEMCDTFPRLKVIIRIVTIAKVVVLLPRSLAALGASEVVGMFFHIVHPRRNQLRETFDCCRLLDGALAVDACPLLGECYHTSFDTANREQEWVVICTPAQTIR